MWLSGDMLEDGPSFWSSLLDALGGTATSEPAFDAVVRTLEEAPDPVIVVVDDFHRLRARTVLGSFAKLIANPPPKAHFVLATRRDPDLPLHRLRLAGTPRRAARARPGVPAARRRKRSSRPRAST